MSRARLSEVAMQGAPVYLQGVDGASVQVSSRDGDPAVLYQDDTGTATWANPLVTRHGRIEPAELAGGEVWLDTGSYELGVSYAGQASGSGFEAVVGDDMAAILSGVVSGEFVDIRSKGAVSGTDCTAALQAAVDDGRPVWLPEGVWIISARIYLHNRTRIYGAGRRSVVLLAPTAGDVDMLKFDDAAGGEDILLQSFVVDGNKANQDPARLTTCVHLTKVTKPQLVDMTLTGGLIEGAYIYLSPEAKLIRTNASGNGFKRADASGLHLDSCERPYVAGCVTDSNGFHGIILTGTTDGVIVGHFAKGNGFDGSRVQYASNRNRFLGFHSQENFRGIYFTTDSTLNRVDDGTFIGNEASALVFNNAYTNYFVSNHVENNQYAVETVTAADKNFGYANTWRANRSGILNLVAGSTFNAIPAGAGTAV